MLFQILLAEVATAKFHGGGGFSQVGFHGQEASVTPTVTAAMPVCLRRETKVGIAGFNVPLDTQVISDMTSRVK